MTRKISIVTLKQALARLAQRGSDQDPVFLDDWGGATSDEVERRYTAETTAEAICWDRQIVSDTKDRAGAVKIRFWGRESDVHNTSRPPTKKLKLLRGTLLDMVREREDMRHGAVAVHGGDALRQRLVKINEELGPIGRPKVGVGADGRLKLTGDQLCGGPCCRDPRTGNYPPIPSRPAPQAWARVQQLRTALQNGHLKFEDFSDDFRLGLLALEQAEIHLARAARKG